MRRSISRERCRTKSARRRGCSARQIQNGASSHSPCSRQRGDRVVLAPDSMGRAIFVERVVVNLTIPGQLGQKVRDEPVKPVGLADLAQGNFEVGDAPRRLELAPGQRETQPVRGGLATPLEHSRPEIVDQRVGHGMTQERAHPVGECRKRSSSSTGESSNGASPPQRSNSTRVSRMLPASVVGTAIDDDLGMSLSTIRLSPTPPLARGDRRRGEVLDPDAGMKQLGLMPGHDQGTI